MRGGGTHSSTDYRAANASHFDVDWDPPEARLRNTVPVLKTQYGRALDGFRIAREGDAFRGPLRRAKAPAGAPFARTVSARGCHGCGSNELGFIADALAVDRKPRWNTAPSGRRCDVFSLK